LVPTLVLAVMGQWSLVGWYALFVLPLSIATAAIIRHSHREVLSEVGLAPHHRPFGWLSAVLTFHAVQAPVAIWSYALEFADDQRGKT
jgi:hypothetical protein